MLVFNGYMSMEDCWGYAIFFAVGLNNSYCAGRFRWLHLWLSKYYKAPIFESFLGGNSSFSASSAFKEKLTSFLSSSYLEISFFLILMEFILYLQSSDYSFSPVILPNFVFTYPYAISQFLSSILFTTFRSLFRMILSFSSWSSKNFYLSVSFYFISYCYLHS